MAEAKIAFQGEMGAYSELAAREFFACEAKLCPTTTFEGVFSSVKNDESTHGIVPIENSLTGSIHENYDLLLEYELPITGEIKLRIVHNLIANPGVRMDRIRRIYSHPQALSQCKEFLKKMGQVELITVYDTAAAVRMIRDGQMRDGAAVASAQAAFDYGLAILRAGIEDNQRNLTRFLIISKQETTPASDPKTSIVFSTSNVPGALHKSLGVFATRYINLLKIESRPIYGRPWEYLFYLDFEGDTREERCREALDELTKVATFMKVLGCYEKGKEVDGRVYER
ncbi:MAG TPA: prephenate dehydratase [Candidatus Latescibacteria bacterium]|nr:prephenate dehydratase [Candidatus Latescibacterota bacterium]